MKIAVNTRFLLPNRLEGIGWYTYQILKRWVEKYPEHEFLFLFDRKYDPQFIFGENVTPIVCFPPARHPFLFYWWFEWSLPKVFKRYQPAAFVSPDNFLSLRAKLPTLLVVHDISWKHFPAHVPYLYRKHYEYFMPKFVKRADRIATVSEYSKKDLVDYLNVDASKIDITYNGYNPIFKPTLETDQQKIREKYTNGAPYFIYIGSVHPRKNIPNVLKAFDRFKTKTGAAVKFVLVGRMAWQTGAVGETLNQMQHREDVLFLGYKPTEELPVLIGASLGLIYLSLFEGFGVPVLEGVACGVPVLTSSTSSMPEAGGEAAIFADPYNIDDMTEKMYALFSDQDLRKRLIMACSAHANQFSWDRSAQLLWNSLETLL